MKANKNRRSNQSGFTLLELMIGTVIVGIVAAMAVPSFQTVYQKNAQRAGSRDLESTIKKARSCAISEKQLYGVYIDTEARTYTLFRNDEEPDESTFEEGDSVVQVDTLPEAFNYAYTSMENGVLIFLPNGAARVDGMGYISLMAESGTMMGHFSLQVTPATGRVSSYSSFYTW